MAVIPPEFESLLETSDDIIPSARGDALGPVEHPAFETELDQFERRLRLAREHSLFGVHPDGVGPTLGQGFSADPILATTPDWEHTA